jgi:hypothetical protein
MGDLVDMVEADLNIPKEVSRRIRSLWERGLLSDSNALFHAITEDVKDHAKNSPA